MWGASSLFVGLMDSLNVAYGVKETRSWAVRRAIAIGTMLAAVAMFLLAAIVLLAGPAVAGALRLGAAGTALWSVVQWPLAFVFVVVAFWLGYYILPDRDQAGCKTVLLRVAALAALLWIVATAAFRVYIANFSSYTETYGFLGTFIVLLLWLYVTAAVVLAGGELAADLEDSS